MQDYLDYLPYCDRIWIKQKVTRSNFHKFKILPTATKIPKSTKVKKIVQKWRKKSKLQKIV
jgi:hypothetical protein